MIKKLLLLTIVCFAGNFAFAQEMSLEELKAKKAEKAAELATMADALAKADALKADLAGLETDIKNLSGWNFGALGTLGFNFSQFNNWLGSENPFVETTSYGATGNLFANKQTAKYFWRNGLNVVATKTRLDLRPDKLDPGTIVVKPAEYETTADAVNLSSLFGYKLNSKWAISALGEYRSTLLNNLNSPGFLDIGAGATWTPIPNAVVVFHPLNYNFVMSDEGLNYDSSLGCKVVADYSQSLPMGVAWKTNFSGFVSYSDVPNLSNWTWVNGLSATVWKGLGLGVDFGLRNNKQEGYNTYLAKNELTVDDLAIDDLESTDNPLQSYWVLGLTYSLSK